MYLDYFTLAALTDEFLDMLVGGRVQDSVSIDDTSVGLEIYSQRQRHYLLLSADNRTPRVHLVPEKLRRGLPRPKPFGLLLRRYVEGGIVTHVSQPKWERILYVDIEGPEGEVSLIVEPMERRANLLLVQNGVILECLRRVGPDENRMRASLPAHPYTLPPPQTGKLDPTQTTEDDIAVLLAQRIEAKRRIDQMLSGRLLGISPLLAKEIVHRAGSDEASALFDALQHLVGPLSKREWQPGIVQSAADVAAFSVYPIQSLPGWQPVESVSAALTSYYGTLFGEDAYLAAKAPVQAAVEEAKAKLSAKLASLERSLTDESAREVLRKSGELILAYQYTLTPGQKVLKAQYDFDEPEMIISLDPTLTPLENAQRYFSRYDKAKRALADVPELVEATKVDLAYMRQLENDLAQAASWPDIDDVQQVLQARGYWQGKRAPRMGGGQSAPLRFVTPDGFVMWIGRNSRQNEAVTFDKGSAEDWWLHARDVAGAHVIIKFDGRQIPETVIVQAAEIAAAYSASKAEASVIVDVTQRKHVRKISGAGPGMVTYRNETTRTVRPQLPESLA